MNVRLLCSKTIKDENNFLYERLLGTVIIDYSKINEQKQKDLNEIVAFMLKSVFPCV
jgi:hypothetical protein